MLFIYRIRDCPAAVQELETLDAIAASRPDLDVHAVLVDGSASEAHQAEKDFALRYRIVADPNERLYDELLPPMTPWKAVILRPAFAILAEEGPSTTPAQREAFLQRMNVVAAQ